MTATVIPFPGAEPAVDPAQTLAAAMRDYQEAAELIRPWSDSCLISVLFSPYCGEEQREAIIAELATRGRSCARSA